MPCFDSSLLIYKWYGGMFVCFMKMPIPQSNTLTLLHWWVVIASHDFICEMRKREMAFDSLCLGVFFSVCSGGHFLVKWFFSVALSCVTTIVCFASLAS